MLEIFFAIYALIHLPNGFILMNGVSQKVLIWDNYNKIENFKMIIFYEKWKNKK